MADERQCEENRGTKEAWHMVKAFVVCSPYF